MGVPECLECGACCFSQLPTYVRVSGGDYARLDERAEEVTQFVGHRCFMKLEDGHCAALEIEASGRFVCRIYEQRPTVCRSLERGSPACEAERTLKLARVQAALEQARR